MKGRRVDAVIQARLSSSRMPRKVLLALNGVPLIDHVIARLRASPFIDRVIVATTEQPEDQELVEYCARRAIPCYQGERDNVLARIIGAGEAFQCQRIVRVCSDNPFIDVGALDHQLMLFTARAELDYCTHTAPDGQPIILKPIGLFVEAVTIPALQRVAAQTVAAKYLEHVTMFIYENPQQFNIHTIALDSSINTDYRFTVDYPEDMEFAETIMTSATDLSMASLLRLMDRNPALRERNLQFSMRHRKDYL